ncbi:membrane-bound lytic murein transglycosylase D [Pseudomonas sp. BAY1663]|nr:membrane-bound lytic murein transglycosylase D [Pseudomonas sp. BAY1663]
MALALCIALAGCQSNALRDDSFEQTRRQATAVEQEPIWLTDETATALHKDIWERIREGYKLQEHLENNPRIEQQRLLFASRPNDIKIASERGSPYIHYIVERLEERDMPLELALLPIIESSYDPSPTRRRTR